MVATIALRGEEWDAAGAAEARLLEQLARATRELRLREAQGRRTEEVRGVVQSLRKTLASMAEHGSVLDLMREGFTVRCPAPGMNELWRRGRKLPVRTETLRGPFEAAGIELQPGQILLAERDLARRVLEESLVALSLEEYRVRETKSALLQAAHALSPGARRSAEPEAWPRSS